MNPFFVRSPLIFPIFFTLFFFLSSKISLQAQSCNGIVIDEITHLPVPFANILQLRTNHGTVSNGKGVFSLFLKKTDEQTIKVSSIGYKTTIQKIHPTKDKITILLTPDETQLNEVIIMPDSVLKYILSNAYQRIANNYYQIPLELTGFYREVSKTKENRYLYFGEASLKVQHKGYKSPQEEAQVEILKARITNFPNSDSIDYVKYYQGPFIANWGDFVKRRALFLNPKAFNRDYLYSLEGISHYNAKQDTIYVIGFRSKNSTENKKGRLWINKKNMSYIKIEFYNGKEHKPNPLVPVKFISRSYQTLYTEEEGKYFLKYTSMTSENFNLKTKQNTQPFFEFATTSYSTGDSIKAILPEKRLGYMAVFSMQENNYDAHFWDTYTSIEQDSMLQKQINSHCSITEAQKINQPKIEKKATKKNNITREKILKIAQRVHSGYGLYTNYHLAFSGQPNQLVILKKPVTNIVTQPKHLFLPAYIFYTSFDFNYQWSIQIRSINNLFKDNYLYGLQLYISKSYLIKKMGTPLYLNAFAGLGITRVGYHLGDIDSDKTIELDGQNLGNTTRAYLGNKNTNGTLGIELDYRKRRFRYFLTLQYNPIIKQEDALFFRTRKNIFSTKNATITDFTDADVVSINKNNYRGISLFSLALGLGF